MATRKTKTVTKPEEIQETSPVIEEIRVEGCDGHESLEIIAKKIEAHIKGTTD